MTEEVVNQDAVVEGKWYISAIHPTGSPIVLLAGPFDTELEALRHMSWARLRAARFDPYNTALIGYCRMPTWAPDKPVAFPEIKARDEQ